MKTAPRNPLLLLLTGTLVACGGGGAPSTPGNTAPAVNIKANGRTITADTYLPTGGRLDVSVSDPDIGGSIKKVVYSIDNGPKTDLTPAASMTLALPGLSGGQHEVTVEATDNVGAVTTVKAPFLIDAAAPTLTTVNLNGQVAADTATFTVGDAALLSVTAQDTRGDTRNTPGPVTIRVLESGTLVKSVSGNTLTADLTKDVKGQARTAGTVIFTVEAEDSVGFVRSRNIAVTFNAATTGDNGGVTAPTFTWLSPASDFVKGGGTVTLRATATRNGQDLSSQIAYTATCGTISGNIWTLGTDCADGSKQSVTATVTDGGRSFSSPAKVITVDASDPTVQITSPQQGQSFTQNPIKISVTGTDAVSGLDRILVEAKKDGDANYTQVGVVTAASGDVTWAPMNGTYTLRATATDKTGRTNTTTLSGIKVNLTSSDATPPTVALSPIPATPQRATVTVTATATDNDSGVAKVDLYDGGTLIESKATGVGGKYTFSLDTTKLSDGAHTLRAIAFDNAGLSTETSASLTVDNTAPVVNWISPADGAVTRGEVTLNATTNEGTVTYTVDGTPLSGNKATFSSDGTHTITATAQDAAGNRTSSTIKVTSDATAPTAQIISPTAGSTLTSNPVTINVTGTDTGSGVSSLEVFTRDTATNTSTSVGTVTGASGTVTWTPTSGNYDLTVIATDKAGNKGAGSAPVNVTVKLATADISPPEFDKTAPTATFSRGVITLDGFVQDPESGISQVTLFNGGVRLNATPSLSVQPDGRTRYALTLDSKTLADGSYTLTIQATNGVGLVSNQDVPVNVNNAAPTVTISNPQNGALLGQKSDLTVKAVANDTTPGDDANIKLEYSVDGGDFSAAAPTLPNGKDADGLHTVTVRATDKAGNTGTATSTYTYDGTAPTVQITSPTQAQMFTSTPVTISVIGQDSGTGLASINVYAKDGSGEELIGTLSGNGSVTWYPRKTDGSPYTIRAVATDRAGNPSADATVQDVKVQTASKIAVKDLSIKVPSANPKGAQFTDPDSGRVYVRGPLQVSSTAETNAPSFSLADLQIDGQTRSSLTAPAAQPTFQPTFNFDFDTLNEGLRDVAVRFTDSLGTVDIKKTTVFVDKTAPVITWNVPSLTNKKTVPLSARAVDAASSANEGNTIQIKYSENGQEVTNVEGEGQHTVTATAVDKVGNIGTRTVTFTIDSIGPDIVPALPDNKDNPQEFTTAPITLTATATDATTSVTSMEVKVGLKDTPLTTLGRQNGASYSAVFTPSEAGTYEVEYTAFDAAGNSTVLDGTGNSTVKRVFKYSPSTAPVEKAPAPKIIVADSQTYSGNVSVQVAGNFDSLSQVDRMILQIKDSKDVIDNSTYVTNQANATFSVDTTKLANGEATLELIAYTKSGLRNISTPAVKLNIKNVLSPKMAVASPSDGATVTTPSVPVKVTITNAGTFAPINVGSVKIALYDYRGQLVTTKTESSPESVKCVYSNNGMDATCDVSFDIAGLPADKYIIRAEATANVQGGSANTPIEASSSFTANTVSVNPPAATISFPAAVTLNQTDANGNKIRIPARIDSGSGFFATVSDNTSIQYVEARIVGPYAEGNIETDGTRQCQASGSIVSGENEINVLVLNVPGAALSPYKTQDVFVPKLDIDGSTYVPDSKPGQRYDLRVTTADADGNRNIQCVPVKVERGLTRPGYTVSTSTSPATPSPAPGELTFTSGVWTLNNVPANSRVIAVYFANGKQVGTDFFAKTTGTPISVSQNFSDVGTYSVSWLIEDMSPTASGSTGVVTSQSGGFVNVSRNP
ncbi:beta strand repeat-containing protein [Deinococcus sp. ME38]|uniref:beta strand repeat-containing protein n=1 Tax=Deinococcus sp. ME38 TaxID=3400344 RepID=UPI003B5A0B0A